MPATNEVSLSEAKAKLSAIVDDVQRTGEEYVITRRGEAVAVIAPAPQRDGGRALAAYGMLSDHADPEKIPLEKGVWERMAVEKYAEHAGH